jgi:hypothetical protein
MQDKIVENPYKILDVSPLASNAEITKAFSIAMKQRKYPPDAIAKARKSLMNPDERVTADYLSPVIPLVKRFKSIDVNDENRVEYPVEERLTPTQIDRLIQLEIDKIELIDRSIDSDRELANLVWDL